MRFAFGKLASTALATVALLLAMTTRASAQDNVTDTPAPPRNAYTIAGVVVNSVTGEPVRRALVQLSDLPVTPPGTLTDSEGRFQFADLPESDIALAVRKPGFFNDQELHPDSLQFPRIVHVDSNTPSIVLKLVPEGTISGQVSTNKGEALEDVPVRILEQRVFDGRKQWVPRGQSSTDEDGQFHIANLAPGLYLLEVGPSYGAVGFYSAGAGRPREEAIGKVFFPGVPEIGAATPIAISAGQQARADFSLKAEALFKVSGTVLGLAPGMGSAPQFTTKAGEPVTSPVTIDAQTGKFEAKVPGGSYVLMVRTADPNGAILGADLPLAVNADVEGITLVLGPTMSLPIHIEARPSSSPGPEEPAIAERLISGSQLVDQDAGPSTTRVLQQPLAQVRLISAEMRLELQQFQADEQNSVFAVRNLTPGKYTVQLVANPPWYVQSATWGATDAVREDLVFAPGRRSDPLEVVLRDDGAQLSGTVLAEGQTASGAVLIIPDQGALNQARLVQTGPAGQFQFDFLAPGDYSVLAFDSIEGFEFRNPEVLEPYLSKAVRVSLSAKEQTSVSVERIQRGK
jgi:hypothetical protein